MEDLARKDQETVIEREKISEEREGRKQHLKNIHLRFILEFLNDQSILGKVITGVLIVETKK